MLFLQIVKTVNKLFEFFQSETLNKSLLQSEWMYEKIIHNRSLQH